MTAWEADGSYVVTLRTSGAVEEQGQADAEGDVLIFRAVGGICANKDGHYRVLFDGADRFTYELVEDACTVRADFVDGFAHVRSTE